MDDSDTDNSNMFKVDQSQQHICQPTQKRLQKLFNKDKVILNDDQKRMVVYGSMQKQSQSIYQILQPYFWKMATVTGEVATVAGKGIYSALTTGAIWVYDKVMNTVIPYTKEELPKLFFIIKNGQKKQTHNYQSDSFHVLEIDQSDYDEIKKKQDNKNTNTNKKKIFIPLDPNDPQNNAQFMKFLQNQGYKPENSFPIDVDSENQSQSFMVPSAKFKLIHKQVMNKIQKQQQDGALEQYQSQVIVPKQEEKIQNNEQKKQEQPQTNVIKSIIDQPYYKMVQDYKKVPKLMIKLKDGLLFDLQGKNSIQYDLLDGIQRDQDTQVGYLVKSKIKFNRSDQDGPSSGQAPLLEEKIQIKQKIVDNQRKVRVQIPLQDMPKKVHERELELA